MHENVPEIVDIGRRIDLVQSSCLTEGAGGDFELMQKKESSPTAAKPSGTELHSSTNHESSRYDSEVNSLLYL